MPFFSKKIISDIIPGLLQAVINQGCGLVIFLVLSIQLDKAAFGEMNWALAVLLTTFSILSFGIDQLVVKKIAAGDDAPAVVSPYVLHTLLTGLLFYGLLLLANLFCPAFFTVHYFLLWLALGKLAVFFASPFKQLSNGRERFVILAIMMVVSNVVRAVALLLLFWLNKIEIRTVVIVFIAGDAAELLLCWLLARYRLHLRVTFANNWQRYKNLLKVSIPQLGTAIVTAASARIDWVLMGLMGMTVPLAHYSFAYKMYEMATLPLWIIGPLLIPRFARMYSSGQQNNTLLFTLLRREMVIAAATVLLLCMLWVPVTDGLTHGRYGAVNSNTILLLAASIPFLYLNNLWWTILFVKGQLRPIFFIMLITFLCNLTANIVLIPLYGGNGAAAAWLLAMVLQSMLLLRRVNIQQMALHALWLPLCLLCAAVAGYGALFFFNNIAVALPVAILLYLLLVWLTRAVRPADIPMLRLWPKK
jgi:O-antigen/teichoic acid export membrane protein